MMPLKRIAKPKHTWNTSLPVSARASQALQFPQKFHLKITNNYETKMNASKLNLIEKKQVDCPTGRWLKGPSCWMY
jgi:hypothetical protein